MNELLMNVSAQPKIIEIDFTKHTVETCKNYIQSLPDYVSDNLDKLQVKSEYENNKLWKYGQSKAINNPIFEFKADNLSKCTLTMYFKNASSQFAVCVFLNRTSSYRCMYYTHSGYARSYLEAPNSVSTCIDQNISLSGRQGKYITTVCDFTKEGWKGKVSGNICIYNYRGWDGTEYASDAYFNYLKLEYSD